MNYEDKYEKEFHPPHYYGDIVRSLFVFAGIILLITIPLDKELLRFYLIFGVIATLIIVFFAGLTSPRNRWVMVTDLLISSISFVLFEYFAIARYVETESFVEIVFILRQIIAFTFLLSVYFSTKTLRGYRK